MKKHTQRILIKSIYVLLVTTVAWMGIVFGQTFLDANWGATGPADGDTLSEAMMQDVWSLLKPLNDRLTLDATSTTLTGDLVVDGSICDPAGNCVAGTPTLECTGTSARYDGTGWKNVDVFCPAGYKRTGCSMNYNAGTGGTWGNSCIPLPNEGCACGSGMTTGWVECHAVCCRIV